MRDIKDIARDTLKCALSWEVDACLIGNVTAQELAALAKYILLLDDGGYGRTRNSNEINL